MAVTQTAPSVSAQPASPPADGVSRARAVARVLPLLLPIAAEAWLRRNHPGDLLLPGAAYLAGVLLFAALAPRLELPGVSAIARRWRWPLAAVAVVSAAAGIYLALGDPRQWVLLPLWLVGAAAWLVAWPLPASAAPSARRPLLALSAIMLGAAALRLWALGSLQPITVDELDMLPDTLRLADRPRLTLFDANNDLLSQLQLAEYLRLAAFKAGGATLAMARLPSVLIGLAEVALLFMTGRLLFGARVGLVAAALLATLTAHLAFSRNAAPLLEASLLWTGLAYLLARALRDRSPAALAWAGTALSLCLYLYWAGRPAVAFVALALLLAALDPAVRGRWLGVGALALLAGFVVGAGPMLAAYLEQPSLFLFRSEKVGWLGQTVDAFRASGDWTKLRPVWDHLAASLLGYNLYGSADNHYLPGRGVFLLLPAALMFAGIAAATLRLRDWRMRLVALWFWGTTLALATLSDVTPVTHRSLPTLAVGCLAAALGFELVVAAFRSVGARVGRAALGAGVAVLAVFMLLEAWFFFGDYGHRDYERWQDQLAKYVLSLGQGERAVVVPGPSPMGMALHAGGKPFEFASDLERRVSGDDLGRAVDQLPDLTDAPTVSYLVHSERLFWLDVIRAAEPTGQELRLLSTDQNLPDRLAWIVHRRAGPPPAAGLRMTARDASGRQVELTTPALAVDAAALPPDVTYPVDLEWRGWARVNPLEGEPLRFVGHGSAQVQVRLGDLRVDLAPGRTVQPPGQVAPVGYPLYATARLNGPTDSVRVEWNGARRGTTTAFPADQVTWWPGPPRVIVEWLTEDGGRVLKREHDAMIADNRYMLRAPQPGSGRYLVRWSGTLRIDRPGAYELDVLADGPVRLVVDGRQLWPPAGSAPRRLEGPPEARRRPIELSAGEHTLQVERLQVEGGQVALLWRYRGGEATLIPPDAFVPVPWP